MKVLIAGAGIGGLTAALALLRRGFDVEVHEQASALRGHRLEPASLACTPTVAEPAPIAYAEPLVAHDDAPAADPRDAFDWPRFVLEVLYLLPPLLALPLFVMALRRPRRRDA